MKNKSFKINVKNGFYIGDLCYALNKKISDEVWGGNNYEDGQYVDLETKAESVTVGTAYGDGEYESSNGVTFPVDAGIIGVADLAICDGNTSFGKVVPNYSGTVLIRYENGTITVSWKPDRYYSFIEIYTSDEEDYDEDEDSEEEDW